MKKRVLTLALALVMLCCALPVSAGAADKYPTFSDVGTGQWFLDDVKYVWQQGLMDGVIDFQFYPDEPMDRLTMVKALHRLEGEPKAPSAGFTDVDSYDSPAVDWAVSQGIVKGYGGGKFGPYDSITREQMAAILFRYVTAKGLDGGERSKLTGYSDYSLISGWALEPMAWAGGVKLIKGMGDGTVKPQGTADRSQGAAVIHRFCENVIKLPPKENPPEFVPANLDNEIFRQLAGEAFYFGSGAGAWGTSLEIEADGSFSGEYHDSDMGDTGPGYPNGTFYYCSFRGKFVEPTKLDNYTYSVRCYNMVYDNVPDTEEIIDGVKCVYTEPYGMEGDGLFRIYKPGKSTAGFSEDFLFWLQAPNVWPTPPATLPFYVIHNLEYDYAFFN